MAKPSLKNEWLAGVKRPQPFYAENTKTRDNWDYTSYWLGRSCGARVLAGKHYAPKHLTGIVVYEGTFFKDKEVMGRKIDHVETKNGPLTIVNDLLYDKEYRKEKVKNGI